MKKMLFYCIIALFFGSTTLFACSNNQEAESEKGRIEKMTEKTGKEIADKIQTPIEKARSVKNQQDDRSSAMEETLPEQ